MENQEIKTKRCPKCGRELPLNEFYLKRAHLMACKHGVKNVKIRETGLSVLTRIAIPNLRNLRRDS